MNVSKELWYVSSLDSQPLGQTLAYNREQPVVSLCRCVCV